MVRKNPFHKEQVTKKANGIIAALSAIMLTVPLTLGGITALANNNSDTYECFSFSGDGTQRSDWRHKEDTTSCYLKCYNSSDSETYFKLDIYGTNQHNNTSGSYCGRQTYTFSEGDVKYMWNDVYETYGGGEGCSDNDSSAIIYYIASPQGSSYDDYECLWSPDNMSGHYGDYFFSE